MADKHSKMGQGYLVRIKNVWGELMEAEFLPPLTNKMSERKNNCLKFYKPHSYLLFNWEFVFQSNTKVNEYVETF